MSVLIYVYTENRFMLTVWSLMTTGSKKEEYLEILRRQTMNDIDNVSQFNVSTSFGTLVALIIICKFMQTFFDIQKVFFQTPLLKYICLNT